MIFKQIALQKKLKKTSSYISHQNELDSYRKHGITEYVFKGACCDVCKTLDGKVFSVDEAEVGVNLPPMHLNCTCTIMAKSRIDLFKDRNGTNPLRDNPKFEEWKKKQK